MSLVVEANPTVVVVSEPAGVVVIPFEQMQIIEVGPTGTGSGSGGSATEQYRTFTFLENIDAFNYAETDGGTITRNSSGIVLDKGPNAGGSVLINSNDWNSAPIWDLNPSLGFIARSEFDPDKATAFVTFGGHNDDTADPAPAPDHFGFLFQDDAGTTVIRGTVGNSMGSTVTNPLEFNDEEWFNTFFAKLISGDSVEFYIDGTLVATVTDNIPTGAITKYPWGIGVTEGVLGLAGIGIAYDAGGAGASSGGGSGASWNDTVPTPSPNGIATVFTTPSEYEPGQIAVFLNGLKEIHFTETSSTTFTMSEAPLTGDELTVLYQLA